MVEPLAIVALALLVVAVAGSVVPLLPGALLSLVGVLLYWWQSGYAEPGPILLVALVLVGLVGVIADYFAGAVSAAAGGASTVTTALAAIVGVVLFFVAGPLGVVVGVMSTVFAVEFYRHRDPERSLRTAIYAAVGMLASTVIQALLTVTMLVTMLLVHFL